MTNKENALRILTFDHPERMMQGLPAYSLCYFGCNHEGFDGDESCGAGAQWTDVFGVTWKKEFDEYMGLTVVNPLADPAALEGYRMPDPDSPVIYQKIYDLYDQFLALPKEKRDDLFLVGEHRDTLWEKAYMLVGMENLMLYFYEEPEFCKKVLHQIMDFQLGIAKHYLKCGIEVASLTDDLGTQRSLFFSKDIFREFFMPEYMRLISLYKAHNVRIGLHSCGHVEELIDLFIEMGIDTLNPVQATANDLRKIRAASMGKLTLHGAISSDLLMTGTPEQIRADVLEKIEWLGKEGGYFCCPDQGMPYPEESLRVLAETVEAYRYS